MEQQERELLERIKQQAKEIEVPMSLRPGFMETNLHKMIHQKKRRVKQASILAAGLAAVIGIACLVGVPNRRLGDTNPVAESIRELCDVKMAESYGDVYAYLKRQEKLNRNNSSILELFSGGGKKGSSMEMSVTSDGTNGNVDDFSQTNTRDSEVDEADVAITDGRYLYVVTDEGDGVGVVDTKGGKLQEITTIKPEDCRGISEIYVQNERLIILCRRSTDDKDNIEHRNAMATVIYDISEIDKPRLLNTFTQSGTYYTSRLYGDYLYVFSEFYVSTVQGKDNYETYVPNVNGEILPCNRICIPDTDRANRYTVIVSINIKEAKETKDEMAILSDDSLCYVSTSHIYMCDPMYNDQGEKTTSIRKISYQDGELEGAAKVEVKGYLKDSFCLDEYKGYLRMVVTCSGGAKGGYDTTSNANTNSVYVLDENLEMTGEISGLAEDERVYSARFMGDTGYFVTFRETDPLFTVDLSNPKEPKIIGALKIPGFSEYLHPYGDGLLLGIGMEVDDKGVVASEVKLSMFDISDPADVKEIDKHVIEGAYYSTAFENYKSVTIDAERNMIGFSAQGAYQTYYLYEYEKGEGFTCNMEEGVTNDYNTRGIYIGDIFYLITGSYIESYSLENYERIDYIAI